MPSGRLRRPGRGFIVIGLLVVAVALLASVQPTWLSVTGPAATGQVRLSGAGTAVAPLVPAAAVVLAAAALASALAGSIVRGAVLVMAALAAAGAAIVCGMLLLDPTDAGSQVLSAGNGVSTRASSVSLTGLPTVALVVAVAGVLLAVAGLWARTPKRTSRFEAESAESTTEVSDHDPAGAWDALSRGDDPTDRPG